MTKGRLEAFSDGVMAIILTIMVLELKSPRGHDFQSLQPLIPGMLSYALSFLHVGIYWNNHHHLLQAIRHVNGATLWANLHLLFWLSLIPLVTNWMGESHFSDAPVAAYGVILLLSAIAYYILTLVLVAHHGPDSAIAHAIGRDIKGKLSIGIYLTGISLAFVHPYAGCGLYLVVAVMWLIPDRRIESAMTEKPE